MTRAAGRPRAIGGASRRAAAAVLAWAAASSCLAYGGFAATLPAVRGGATASPRTGLRMAIDARWIEQAGYRPVRVGFLAKAAAKRDRKIELTLFAQSRNSRDAEVRVEQSFTLPAGQTAVDGVVLLPMMRAWRVMWWETRVDGEVDDALSADRRRPQGLSAVAGAGEQSDLALLRPTEPTDVARLFKPSGQVFSRSGDVKEYLRVAGLLADEAVSEPQTDWIAYTGADVLTLTADGLDELADDDEELRAVLRWVAAGGAMWVEEVGDGVAGLNRLAELLDAASWRFGVGVRPVDRDVEGAPGWRHERLQPSLKTADVVEDLAGSIASGDLTGLAATLNAPTSRGWYAVRDYGLGRVQAFPGTVFDAPDSIRARDRKSAVGRWQARAWTRRHGLSQGAACEQFGNLLIPGVGVAPVAEFQVLITLFVIGIGPLNYWLLRRSRRLHLLVLTTPLAAAAVTLGLFVYALVGDGFGVKARVRSLTLLSQPAGEAVSWSRVSHYAGSAPGEPFGFGRDTAVYPLRPAWESAIAEGDTGPLAVAWSDEEQTLQRGWLPTRTAAQHLVIRAGETERQLRFRPAAAPTECANRLGAEVELVLALGDDGRWRRGGAVADGGAGRLEPVERNDALAELRVLLLDNEPEFPVGAGKDAADALNLLGRQRWVGRRNRGGSIAATLEENLMNDALDRLVGLTGGEPLGVPPRTYIAITRTAVETPLGFAGERVREVGSFHIVLGRW